MSGSFSVGGLMSGLDTDAIIESLVNVKTAQLVAPLEDEVVEYTSMKSALEDVETALSGMRSAASTLKYLSTYEGRIGNSSSSSDVEIQTVSQSAIKGTYIVTVNDLAQADREYFNGVSDSDVTQFGTGTINIESNGISTAIEIDATNNTLEGIRDAINASGAEVIASIVNDGDPTNPYRLVLTSTETGADAAIIQDIHTVLTLTRDAVTSGLAVNMAQDANFLVNGLQMYSESNTVTGAIPGVSFTMLIDGNGLSNITISVNEDYSNAGENIASFINAYNEMTAEFKNQFAVDPTTGASIGVLASDFTLQTIQGRLNEYILTLQPQLGGNAFHSLSQIGITLDSDGFLELDQTVLTNSLAEDSDSVARLFQGMSSDVGGIADFVYDYLSDVTDPSTGILYEKKQIWQRAIDDDIDQIEVYEERIANYEQSLKDKFLYLEQTLLALQNKSSSLEAAQQSLESLNNNN